ncbi:MAG TPA: hypothetical protein GX503_04650 [Clostridiales bacterium]|nr:hypothetical protein [Clostridiales bacterium]
MLFQKILFAIALWISFICFQQIEFSHHFKRKWGNMPQRLYFLLIGLGVFIVFSLVIENLLKVPLSIATLLEGILIGAIFATFLNLKNK